MKIINFIKKILVNIFNSLKNLIINILSNIESVIILLFASIGLTTILAEIPFHYALPAFIDAPLIIPIVSIMLITGLVQVIIIRG